MSNSEEGNMTPFRTTAWEATPRQAGFVKFSVSVVLLQ